MTGIITIATWNINSVRLRLGLVHQFTQEIAPDILCLQETKCVDNHFPLQALRDMGYEYCLFSGQKSYNGVAILSKMPLQRHADMDVTGDGAKRYIAAKLDNDMIVHNFYIPAGGDEPDASINPKFANKLAFLDAVTQWTPPLKDGRHIAVGDYNIAPYEHDVWSHRQLLKVVSHTPIEVERLEAFRAAGGWIDTAREFVPMEQKSYSWWSYRNRDWRASNRGRRLDHIWVTEKLRPALRAYTTHPIMRDAEKPSDHIPVMLTLEL